MEKFKLKILGVNVDSVTFEQALARVEFFLRSGRQHYIVTPNPEFILHAQKDKVFKSILNSADLSLLDGFGLYLAAPPFALKRRICGVDFMEALCQYAATERKKVFLLGAENGAAKKTVKSLTLKFPDLIAESRERHEDCEEVILRFQPEMLFVALGHPKQEKWIYENLRRFPSVKVAMGVGGSFDFLSGNVKRAPRLIRKLGLEWLWRLIIEPKRAKRIFNAVIVFPWLVIVSKIRNSQ